MHADAIWHDIAVLLYVDAVLRGRRSALCMVMPFCVAGA